MFSGLHVGFLFSIYVSPPKHWNEISVLPYARHDCDSLQVLGPMKSSELS